MGKLTTNLDAANHLHQKYFDGEFVVMAIKRSGSWDFPPYSFVYGLSDIGSWNGFIATDGNKVIVTKSKYWNVEDIKDVYEIDSNDIIKVKPGTFKNTIQLKKSNAITKSLAVKIWNIFFLFGAGLLLPGNKIFQFRIEDDFNNKEQFFLKLGFK